jgi:geranyl-CoA carboxylase alpha subunit
VLFDTLLVANRGEIACRVIRSAKALGLRTVAVYADADRDALHVHLADTAVHIGAAPARDSYLNIDRVIDACRVSGAGAVHPGYGFLSENAAFARACRDAGVTFVGPTPAAIDALGNKSAAKRLAEAIGVPCLAGYSGPEQDDATLLAEAQRIGAPLMIKAAAGGGGRGMRRCDDVGDAAAVRALLQAARAEALSSFGAGTLLLERRVEGARHVEVQVFGDQHGNAVHLGERDCSTQRRHQKILEEAPAPGVSAELRARMGDAAVKLVREVGYIGAGTVEFLLTPDGEFHFLEINTRLQVEHPVTEAITGLDLVEWQLRIARGEALPLKQSDIRWQGHAIEARLCAEDAFAGFAPQSGAISHWHVPRGEGLRIDHGLVERPIIPPHYDSMIAKLIALGADREQARRRLLNALAGSTVLGLRTNRDFLLQALAAPGFVQPALLSTQWLERDSAQWLPCAVDARWVAVAACLSLHRASRVHGPLALFSSTGRRETPMHLEVAGQPFVVRLAYGVGTALQARVDEADFSLRVWHDDGLRARIDIDGTQFAVCCSADGWLDAFGVCEAFADTTDAPPRRDDPARHGLITSRMHGQLVRLEAAQGLRVRHGQFLLAIEAMKMEHRIEAPIDGTVVEVGATVGAQVAPGQLLLRIEADAPN